MTRKKKMKPKRAEIPAIASTEAKTPNLENSGVAAMKKAKGIQKLFRRWSSRGRTQITSEFPVGVTGAR